MFTTLRTPWPTRYISEKVYKHVDINCDAIISQQVDNSKKYILHHAEVPGDGGLVIPRELRETAQCLLQNCQYLAHQRSRTFSHIIQRENENHVTLPKEVTTNHVKGVDNAGNSIVVCDGIRRVRCGCSSCNKWREPIVYNRRC